MLPFKSCIQAVQPYIPGRPIEEVQRERRVTAICKLASNENPLGPSPKAIDAIISAATQMALYPDGGCYVLKQALAEHLKVAAEHLIIGNGSNEIIEFIVKGFLGQDEEVLSSEYAFAVYPILTQVYGGRYTQVSMRDYRYDLQAMQRAINARTRIIFIANPNNPTGTYVTRDELSRFVESIRDDILICIDEAYFEFVDRADYPNGIEFLSRDNVVVLRTFSKIYGLAGLRVGYGIASKRVTDYFNRIRQPFNVNAMAQIAAVAAIGDTDHCAATRLLVQKSRRYFNKACRERGIDFIPTVTNFIMMRVANANRAFERFLDEGFIVRSMHSYHLPQFIRVSFGRENENKAFFRAWDKLNAIERL